MKFQDEKTLFRELFGDTPKIRVLEYLLEGRELDHAIGDIAEGAGITRVTLFRMWDELEEADLLEHTRKIGNAKLYKLNMKNPYVKLLAELFDKIINVDFRERKSKNYLLTSPSSGIPSTHRPLALSENSSPPSVSRLFSVFPSL